MATYTWSNFNLQEALSGKLVGINEDETLTGRLQRTSISNIYTVTIQGHEVKLVQEGYIFEVKPQKDEWLNVRLKIATTNMGSEASIGNIFTRQGTQEEGGGEVDVDLSVMEPRDYFAVNALNAMLGKVSHPEGMDDATCLYYAKASYRWAQAMMIAAIDARGAKTEEEEPVTETATASERFSGV